MEVSGHYPLSFEQEQLWFLDQLRSGAREYLMHAAFRLRGPVDRAALTAALTEVTARHSVLRTRYETVDGRPVQIVGEPAPVDLRVVDLTGCPPGERDRRVRDFGVTEVSSPVDLATAPWRLSLVLLAPDDAILLIVVHHIAFDNTSLGIVSRDLRLLYGAYVAGEAALPEPLPGQYADYAQRQRERWAAPDPALTRKLDYWRDRLAALEPLDLPADHPRPASWDPTGDTVDIAVPAELAARLVAVGRASRATPFMVFLAAFNLLLSRYSGRYDINVGASMTGRHRSELAQVVGPLFHTVVLRTDLSGDPTFAELLARTRDTTLAAFARQDVPLQRLVAELVPDRDMSRNPLFQAAFMVHNAQGETLDLPGLDVEPLPLYSMDATFDLSLNLAEKAGGWWNARMLYPTALFDRERIERMVANYLELLTNVAAQPDAPLSRVVTVTEAERERVLGWNPPATEVPDAALPDLFRAQATATPDAVAVVSGTARLSYAELVSRVDRLAGFLRDRGVTAETPVGVAMGRGTDLVVALLGTLAAGGVYVPLPPDLPAERLEFMLADSGVELVLTEAASRDRLPADGPVAVAVDERWDEIVRSAPAAAIAIDAAQAAYVMYTSGSTGRPKGVAVTHGGIRNRVRWAVEAQGLTRADRVLQKTTTGFDASVWEFLAPLVSGGAVVMAPRDAHRDPAVLVRAAAEHEVTVLQLVPSVLQLVVNEPELADCTALRLVCSAGEPLPAALAERLLDVRDVELYNTYGPTECSIDSTAWRYRRGGPEGVVPIGAALPNVEVFVVDADDQLVPVGVPGELCVGGAGLARGYLGRGDLTAERFTPHPYAATPGARWYRTGDLARWRADGTLEFVGRLDAQVKVRGVRVEPGEVEAVLAAHPSVAAAVVTTHRGAVGDLELVAYVVPADGAEVSGETLRDHLDARLPAAMIPSTVVVLDAFPTLPNGKLDRAKLPAPEGGARADDPGHVRPRTPTEQAVATIIGELVGVERVGAEDDFFALGGHSLLAIRLAHRLRRGFGMELTVGALFEGRTVARIAALIDASTAPSDGPEIVPVARDGALPTSFGQRRLWFLDQLEPGSSEYLIPLAFRFSGPLDTGALRRAVTQVVARHEVLRTRYVGVGGTPSQIVDPPGDVAFDVVDLAGTPDAEPRAVAIIDAASSRPFDLAREHPLRVTVARTAAEEHLVTITLHHIAFDAWSMEIFLRELNEAYDVSRSAAAPPARPLPVQYADFAAWQRDRESEGVFAEQLEYWRGRLAGLTPVELTADRPRPAERDPHGDAVVVEVPAAVATALDKLGARTGATPFMVLLAAFDVLLGRYTGRTDVAVGTPVAGRSRPETEHLVGFFVNNLVMRADLGGNPTFTSLVERVRRGTVEAFANQDVPFEHLVDALQPSRDMSRNPLFQIMFQVQHTAGLLPPTIAGCAAVPIHSGPQVARFDLTLSIRKPAEGGLRCRFEYATALFDRSTIERLAGHYLRLLERVGADPDRRLDELDLLSAAERHTILRDWPNPAADRLDALDPPAERHLCVPELFERAVARTPAATAVVFQDQEISFAELNARANRLAHRLRAVGVGPETVVGSCLERGVEPVVVLLAVLKAGGVYVPFDPEHPAERLDYMLADAGAHTVVTTRSFADRVRQPGRRVLLADDEDSVAGMPSTNLGAVARPDNLAYIIYTSGSTGRPKGVMIQHRSYAHHCRVIADAYGIGPGERVVLLSALTFDLAMDQIAVTLVAGATLVVSDPVFWLPAELPAKLSRYGVTIMEITPAYYREMLESDVDKLAGMRLMNVGADVVTVADAQRWAATGLPGRFLCNYGPTEATITCMLNPVAGDLAGERGTATLHIGRPVAGTRVHVLDAQLRPLPVGVPGELCIGGVRLARGYHERPELTAERFVPDPFGTEPGARLYRTGDLVRYRPDGTVEFLGRLDHQVKIRGFRIELPEIEAALAKHPAVAAAAVVAREVAPGDKRLVAYLECGTDTQPDIAALRAHLRELLPDYMVPSVWATVPALPLNSNKKVDRAALPALTPSQLDGAREYVAPRDPTEEIIARIWADVLGVDRVGVHDDFFGLGGHSLLATRVLARLRQAFVTELPLRCLFEATTVADLAAVTTEHIAAELDGMTDAQLRELLSREGV
ncbi:amino acid adenylation domain-containing protein [Micromonospora sp. NPDC048999]|uniref:amino acid adenylation domain-containing protein n=1 Tax=Micromonospora sp. NPDC048999 TaxID=3155391 RepID=UPI0033F2A5E1